MFIFKNLPPGTNTAGIYTAVTGYYPIVSNGVNFGVAASGLPSDWAMFNVDGMSGQNRDMTREALDGRGLRLKQRHAFLCSGRALNWPVQQGERKEHMISIKLKINNFFMFLFF